MECALLTLTWLQQTMSYSPIPHNLQTTFVKVVCLCEEWAVHVVYTYVVALYLTVYAHPYICTQIYASAPFSTSQHTPPLSPKTTSNVVSDKLSKVPKPCMLIQPRRLLCQSALAMLYNYIMYNYVYALVIPHLRVVSTNIYPINCN